MRCGGRWWEQARGLAFLISMTCHFVISTRNATSLRFLAPRSSPHLPLTFLGPRSCDGPILASVPGTCSFFCSPPSVHPIITMHFNVVVPKGVHAGQTLRVRCPDGSMGDVKIPKGLREGDSFIFEMSVPDETAVKEAHRARTGGGGDFAAGADSTSAAAGGGPGGTGTASSQLSVFFDRFRHEWHRNAYITSSPEGCGFLDREIVDTRDFIAALGVGMLIGVSIVSGFLVGVLMVTEPDL